jgi:hypothetical protein
MALRDLLRRDKPVPRFFSACNLAAGPGGYGAAALDDAGRIVWSRPMPARGHTIEVAPDGATCAVIDRKPGSAITLIRSGDGAPLSRMSAPEGYSFDGHAVFSSDGGLLYATESRAGDQEGRIAVYALPSGTRVREFASGGIEPHELIWLERDRLLAIGNGGIVDRSGMTAEIESNLALIDAPTGAVIGTVALDAELNTLSIRHLARAADGGIVFAMQDQDAGTEWRPMAGIARADGTVTLLEMPENDLMRLRGYCGSAAVDRSGTVAAVTSPHGGVAAFWSLPEGRYLGPAELRDCCGIAAADRPGSFVLTSGSGTRLLVEANAAGVTARTLDKPANGLPLWDNHLTAAARD